MRAGPGDGPIARNLDGAGPGRYSRGVSTLALVLAALLLPAEGAEPAAVRIEGRIERVDLERRTIVLGTRSGGTSEAREVLLEEGTSMSSGGRPLRVEDLRPGETVAVSVADPAARPLRARRVKMGSSEHKAPSPGSRQP